MKTEYGLNDRIRGGLYGVAIGDAMGATVEFMEAKEIRDELGCLNEITGGGWLNLRPGECTDDTALTLAVALGLVDAPEAPREAIGRHFMRWLDSRPKDIGRQMNLALHNYRLLGSWEEASQKTWEDLHGMAAGNGCIMRTLPITFAYAGDEPTMAEQAASVARMTHPDPIAVDCCIFYNRFAAGLLQGMSPEEAFQHAMAWLEQTAAIERDPAEEIHQYLVRAAAGLTEKDLHSSGFVLDTLVIACHSLLHSGTFEDTVTAAVNLGGDADTAGAVAGGLAGIVYGYKSIPARWTAIIALRRQLDEASEKLVALAASSLARHTALAIR